MSLTPEQVPEEARRRAEAEGYEDLSGFEVEAPEAASLEKLRRWSFIEIDPAEVVYSTRRLGAPITALKRLLVRLRAQYDNELTGQQTRFNVHLLAYVTELERRVAELEARLGEQPPADRPTEDPPEQTDDRPDEGLPESGPV